MPGLVFHMKQSEPGYLSAMLEKSEMARDADFSEPTKKILAQRAGYRCSFPGCGKTTIGPGKSADTVEKTGVAAHIFSASSDIGPRGTGGLSEDDRKKPENGVWMCHTHSTLIDQKSGERYPEPELQRWKALHEARIDHEHRGLSVPTGWVSRIELKTSPLFQPGTSIEFGKVTLLKGRNGTGKTALCDWIAASAGQVSRACRWMHRLEERDPVEFRLHHSNPEPRTLVGKIDDGEIKLQLGTDPVLDLSHALSVIFVSNDSIFNEDEFSRLDALENIGKACGAHRQTVNQAYGLIAGLSLPFIKEIDKVDYSDEELEDVEQGEEYRRALSRLGIRRPQHLRFKIGSHEKPVPYRQLSSREVSIAKISVAIALAHLSSLQKPTILIFDLGANFLPDSLVGEYAGLLGEARFGFQSIFVTAKDTEVKWTGWSVAEFTGEPPSVHTAQKWWSEDATS